MPTVIVDGIEIELAPGERANGIEVAERVGIDVPHYCWHPGLTVVASCRMCLVETGTRNPETGEVKMLPQAGARLPDACRPTTPCSSPTATK